MPGTPTPAEAATTHNLHGNKTLQGCGELLFAKPSSVPAQVWDQSLLWQLQPASGWVFPLNRVPLGQLARSSCLFGVSE